MKFIYFLTFVGLLFASGLIILLTFWYNYPYKPLVFNDPQFPVLTKTVKQGGTLKFVSDYCKYVAETARVSRSFANGLIFSTPEMVTNRETGCHRIVVAVSIPHELPPGIYHLENVYIYKINPIREITISHRTEDFAVIE